MSARNSGRSLTTATALHTSHGQTTIPALSPNVPIEHMNVTLIVSAILGRLRQVTQVAKRDAGRNHREVTRSAGATESRQARRASAVAFGDAADGAVPRHDGDADDAEIDVEPQGQVRPRLHGVDGQRLVEAAVAAGVLVM